MKKLLTAFLCSILFTATAHASTTLESVNVYLRVLNGAGTLTGYGGVGSYTALTATGGTAGTTEDCSTGVTKTTCQNFETATTGYDNGETWTPVAAGGCAYNPVYATTPGRGTQSFLLTNSTGANQCFTEHTYASASTHGFFARIRVNSVAGSARVIDMWDTGYANEVMSLTWGGNDWGIHQGTASATTTSNTYSTATWWYVWVYLTTGSGANGTMNFYASATSTKPGSPTLSITTGSTTTNPVATDMASSTTVSTVEYDQIMESTSDIGSVAP